MIRESDAGFFTTINNHKEFIDHSLCDSEIEVDFYTSAKWSNIFGNDLLGHL